VSSPISVVVVISVAVVTVIVGVAIATTADSGATPPEPPSSTLFAW
jgi:hypothetical protein